MFLEQQISILEWFVKDYVTMKTGVMMLKIHDISEYIKIENSYLKIFHIIPV